ncbi:MAG TPA: undecaprenyl-phosphate glucose phosphotransferase [Steroidobacteraceae bacterium]|nr:undecaprenyl-phosphate glucose phosphotransferase [Steroidobacteraceae bacterium]
MRRATAHWTAAKALRIGPSQPGLIAILRMLTDPLAATGMLVVSALCVGAHLTAPHVFLASLTAAMTLAFRSPADPGYSGSSVVLRWFLIASLLLIIGWTTGTLGLFDGGFALIWLLSVPLVQHAAHRYIVPFLSQVFTSAPVRRTAVVAGANDTGCLLARNISSDPLLAMNFAGYFDDRDCDRLSGVEGHELRGSLSEVADYVRRHHIDVVYCALPCSHPRIRRLLESLHDTTASVYFAPDVLSLDLIQARMDSVAGLPVIALCESPFCGMNGLLKRASDIMIALAAMTVVAPVGLCIAIGIKLTSPGPVLFKQRRYGLDGREIIVYKFRSMTVLEDGAVVRQATRDDPRTTRFGAFLRSTSLDELPQFLNVLQGRMSVIGPRPHAVAHNELYRKLIPGYMMRHKVRPGITGLAQIRGLRGEADTESMRARIECDLEYLRDWSVLLDLRIALRTIFIVLGRNNAY